MNKTISIIITFGIIMGIGVLFLGQQKNDLNSTANSSQNVEVRDGIQYIIIKAGNGYFPKVSAAKINIPTKLIVKTNNTYDCSSSLVIKSIGYHKILSPTGEEIIDLGLPQAGTLLGFCNMGMYSFAVNFE